MSYERQMQQYLIEHLGLLFYESSSMEIPPSVTSVLQAYYQQPAMNFHTDLLAAVQASFVVCKRYAVSIQQEQQLIGGVSDGCCHSGI